MSLLRRPEKYIKIYDYQIHLDNLRSCISKNMEIKTLELRRRLESASGRLTALNPSSVMDRGYAIIKDPEKNVISLVSEISSDRLTINFKDGEIDVEKI